MGSTNDILGRITTYMYTVLKRIGWSEYSSFKWYSIFYPSGSVL